MTDNRPSWDKYFMEIAHKVAGRSTCPRLHVGAVIVKDRRIISTGYNGAPRGLPHCTEVGCLTIKTNENGEEKDHCVRVVHAEQNAIIQAALAGTSTENSTIYVTHEPCFNCTKMIINAGIKKIVFDKPYPDTVAKEFLKNAGVEIKVVGDQE
jgi:dCMP deaminase